MRIIECARIEQVAWSAPPATTPSTASPRAATSPCAYPATPTSLEVFAPYVWGGGAPVGRACEPRDDAEIINMGIQYWFQYRYIQYGYSIWVFNMVFNMGIQYGYSIWVFNMVFNMGIQYGYSIYECIGRGCSWSPLVPRRPRRQQSWCVRSEVASRLRTAIGAVVHRSVVHEV
jgi:hypothetical protein